MWDSSHTHTHHTINQIGISQYCEGDCDIPNWDSLGRYRWYQSHTLVKSVDPTREDACARKGGGL